MYIYLFTCTQRVVKGYGQKDSKGGRQSVKISVGLAYNFEAIESQRKWSLSKGWKADMFLLRFLMELVLSGLCPAYGRWRATMAIASPPSSLPKRVICARVLWVKKGHLSAQGDRHSRKWQCTAHTLTVCTTLRYLITFPFKFRYTPFSIHDAAALSSSHPQWVLACKVCLPFGRCCLLTSVWMSVTLEDTVREPLRLLLQLLRK